MAEFESQADAIIENIRRDGYQMLLNAAEAVKTSAQQLCPVKSGRLRDSIKVDGNGTDSVTVGTDVPYAMFVELGHVERLKDGSEKQVPAQPFLIPAFEEVKSIIRDQGLEVFE